MSQTKLTARIEAIGVQHGVDISACGDSSVYTTPDWTDWSDELLADVSDIAVRHYGPHGDFWTER